MMRFQNISLVRTIFILLLTITFITCTKKENPVEPGDESTAGGKLLDTLITSTNSDVTVNVKSKLAITIPQGAVPPGTKLTVQELKVSELPSDNGKDFNAAYDVSLSSGSTFTRDLTIKINYDPSKLTAGKLKNHSAPHFFMKNRKPG